MTEAIALLRTIRDIFWALDGKPLPTPRNVWIWWQRRPARLRKATRGRPNVSR